MSLGIKRLHLASLQGVGGGQRQAHGFVVTHPGDTVLVGTGPAARSRCWTTGRSSTARWRTRWPNWT